MIKAGLGPATEYIIWSNLNGSTFYLLVQGLIILDRLVLVRFFAWALVSARIGVHHHCEITRLIVFQLE